MIAATTRAPLGGIEPAQFLRTFWQKKPLLLRQAVPEIAGMFTRTTLIALAGREDVESRLVTRAGGRWRVAHGPFRRRELAALPARGWTLLVQGVDDQLPAARALMKRFDFIPYARQDDLMASVAPPGGGVGPHFDSYDVFLLQASGKRRWQLSAQSDLRLVDGAPLRILERFAPEKTFDVEPGDLLYLPPRYAHDGVALSDSITCSVGFRAPSRKELCQAFLAWLEEEIDVPGRYADRDLALQDHPARIDRAMLARVQALLAAVRWRRDDIARFLGEYLTEPKPQTWFSAPRRPLAPAAFLKRARARGVRLALKSRMLFDDKRVFLNGESVVPPARARAALIALAGERALAPWPRSAEPIAGMLHQWYKCGYVELL